MGDGAEMARAVEMADDDARAVLAALLRGGQHWITRKGEVRRFREMDTSHLANVCRMLERSVDRSNREELERVTMHGEDEPPDPDGPKLIELRNVPPYVGARKELHYRDPARYGADLNVPLGGPGMLGGKTHQEKEAWTERRCDNCAGSGHVYRETDPIGMVRDCPKCGGSGTLVWKGGVYFQKKET